jgi:hypothetical protein
MVKFAELDRASPGLIRRLKPFDCTQDWLREAVELFDILRAGYLNDLNI